MNEKEVIKENIFYASFHDCLKKIEEDFENWHPQNGGPFLFCDDIPYHLKELNNHILETKYVMNGLCLRDSDLKKDNDHYWFSFARIEDRYDGIQKIIQPMNDDINRHVHPYESDADKDFLKNIHHLFVSIINVNQQEINRLQNLDIPKFEECRDKKEELLDLMHHFHGFMVNSDIQLMSKLKDFSKESNNVGLEAPVLFSDENIPADNTPSPIIHRSE